MELLTVAGAVQGVGFRPFVKMLADACGLAGKVKNSGGIVKILVADGETQDIAAFCAALVTRAPAGAMVLRLLREEISPEEAAALFGSGALEGGAAVFERPSAERFAIVESTEESAGALPVFVPDIALCDDCLAELRDPADRRYRYPLISCARCGPRFTILEALPYDRERTAMRKFAMCPACEKEYAGRAIPGAGQAASAHMALVGGEQAASAHMALVGGEQAASAHMALVGGEQAASERAGAPSRMRRRHAQTISCYACGPQMRWIPADLSRKQADSPQRGEQGTARVQSGEDAIGEAVRLLRAGGVVGLKGVGGFQLLVDPRCEEAVRRLREMKGREAKPFALLFPSLESVRACCVVSDGEAAALLSAARPIVLLAPAENACGDVDGRFSAVRGDSAFIGAFLPASGAHQMLADACGPLIATSANRSGEPMLLEEEAFSAAFFPGGGADDGNRREAGGGGSAHADGMLTHDREILAPVDDSVVFVENGASAAGTDSGLRFVRRARGYVPLPLFVPQPAGADGDILAFGADMKAAFAFARGDRIIVSQPFGDMGELAVQRAFLAELARLMRIYDFHPSIAVCDAHPAYRSAHLAAEFAKEHGLPAPFPVYHHHAHALAVMAERGLRSCVAIVCDGTGYGPDGTIWGGEVLVCRGAEFARAGHLPEFPLIGGDAAARDAELSAASWLLLAKQRGAFPAGLPLSGVSEEKARTLRAAYAAGAGTRTTSAGRLFDAAACMLGVARENRFEGECAQALEAAAHRWLRGGGRWEEEVGELLAFMDSLPERLRRGADRGRLACGFHVSLAHTLARIAAEAAEGSGGQDVVLAGGCFANRLLLGFVRAELEPRGLAVHVGAELPAGDGAVAAGQAYAVMQKLMN